MVVVVVVVVVVVELLSVLRYVDCKTMPQQNVPVLNSRCG